MVTSNKNFPESLVTQLRLAIVAAMATVMHRMQRISGSKKESSIGFNTKLDKRNCDELRIGLIWNWAVRHKVQQVAAFLESVELLMMISRKKRLHTKGPCISPDDFIKQSDRLHYDD
ncbi:hypothetical protein EVAR_13002_1 [Eumeta japonica]|uniref:Uncharacterized protein n=1 Tax=Eumeta variegata TaxID=151549 RepID=A0A4C1TWW2_EUMVA|nr:hypothetical protein EVAR_13002_1 [Eumeta japonica]